MTRWLSMLFLAAPTLLEGRALIDAIGAQGQERITLDIGKHGAHHVSGIAVRGRRAMTARQRQRCLAANAVRRTGYYIWRDGLC